jgi:hypothetical protein
MHPSLPLTPAALSVPRGAYCPSTNRPAVIFSWIWRHIIIAFVNTLKEISLEEKRVTVAYAAWPVRSPKSTLTRELMSRIQLHTKEENTCHEISTVHTTIADLARVTIEIPDRYLLRSPKSLASKQHAPFRNRLFASVINGARSPSTFMNDFLSIASGYALRRSSSQTIAVQAAALSDRSVP